MQNNQVTHNSNQLYGKGVESLCSAVHLTQVSQSFSQKGRKVFVYSITGDGKLRTVEQKKSIWPKFHRESKENCPSTFCTTVCTYSFPWGRLSEAQLHYRSQPLPHLLKCFVQELTSPCPAQHLSSNRIGHPEVMPASQVLTNSTFHTTNIFL